MKVLEKEYSDLMISTGGRIVPNFIQVIATAYYNCAVEYEYLNEFPESLIYYQKAYKVGLLHLGSESSVSNLFLHHFEDAK